MLFAGKEPTGMIIDHTQYVYSYTEQRDFRSFFIRIVNPDRKETTVFV